jgi:hypothetical protein
MICPFCKGTGMILVERRAQPCLECGGCGHSHCCDGLQACGEVEGDDRLERARAPAGPIGGASLARAFTPPVDAPASDAPARLRENGRAPI